MRYYILSDLTHRRLKRVRVETFSAGAAAVHLTPQPRRRAHQHPESPAGHTLGPSSRRRVVAEALHHHVIGN